MQKITFIGFSDYRVQDISLLFGYLDKLQVKPDFIFYAGDDINRFNSKNANSVNFFEQIAVHSNNGLCIVAGNDDTKEMAQALISGKNVYNIHENPLIINDIAIIGLEGATSDIGCLLYTEKEVKSHLNQFYTMTKGKKLLIVSHPPPFGYLDRAIRYGIKNIGSKALREFIKVHKKDILAVVCGHCHFQGGKETKYYGVPIINCASHDDMGASGKIALISIENQVTTVEWRELLSLSLEQDLTQIINVGERRANQLIEHGVNSIKELAALTPPHPLFEHTAFKYSINLHILQAKALLTKDIIQVDGIPSPLVSFSDENLYYLDTEYDSAGVRTGNPFGIFLIGIMCHETEEITQYFLDSQDEKSMLLKFKSWVEDKDPKFMIYGASSDNSALFNSLKRLNINSQFIKNRFFDLHTNVLNTQSYKKQKVFFPLPDLKLKRISDFLGFISTADTSITDGRYAPLLYKNYLKSGAEKYKRQLIEYNKDDLKRLRYVYLWLKQKFTPD